MDTGKLLLLGGVGVGAWWLYSQSTAAAGPTDTTGAPSGTFVASGGGTSASPRIADEIWNGNTMVAVYDGKAWHSPPLTDAEVSAVTAQQIAVANQTMGPSPTGTSAAGYATTPPPFFPPTLAPSSGVSSLSAIWTAAQKAAASDPNFTPDGTGDLASTPYRWTFYLGYVQPTPPAGYSGTWPPDPAVVFPGADLNQPMSGKTFWGTMQPYLAAKGLSGLFGMRGLGDLSDQFMADIGDPSTWASPTANMTYVPPAAVATPTLFGLPVATTLALGAGALVLLMVMTGGRR